MRDVGLIPGWEDPLEEEMATHSSILDWKIPGTEEPGGLQSMGLQRVGDTEHAHAHHLHTLILYLSKQQKANDSVL